MIDQSCQVLSRIEVDCPKFESIYQLAIYQMAKISDQILAAQIYNSNNIHLLGVRRSKLVLIQKDVEVFQERQKNKINCIQAIGDKSFAVKNDDGKRPLAVFKLKL